MQQRILDELFACVGDPDFDIKVEELVTSKKIDINAYWKDDNSILMAATKAGQVDTVNKLIALGANVNARSMTGRTALMEAIACKQFTTVPLLLASGADIFAQDQDGHTPISICTSMGIQAAFSRFLQIAAEVKERRLRERVQQAIHTASVEPDTTARPTPTNPPASDTATGSLPRPASSDVPLPVSAAHTTAATTSGGAAAAPRSLPAQVPSAPPAPRPEPVSAPGPDSMREPAPEPGPAATADSNGQKLPILSVSVLLPKHLHQHTWLQVPLTLHGLHSDAIEHCEQVLVRDHQITSLKLFLSICNWTMSAYYLQNLGIKTVGAQLALLEIYHTERNAERKKKDKEDFMRFLGMIMFLIVGVALLSGAAQLLLVVL